MTSWSSVGGLGRSRGRCRRSCATLGAYVRGLGPLLGLLWAVLGCSWGLRGRSWPLSGPLLAVLCRSWPTLGTSVGDLGLLLRPAWAVLAALGAFVGGLVPLLGPMLAVLGRSWDLCWRSWAVLGRKVALARAGRRSGKRARPKSGPNPSGSVIRKGSGPLKRHKRPEAPHQFFL